jgi:translation initiation factor 6
MKAIYIDFNGDNNIGLFGKACDRLCLISNRLEEKKLNIIKDTLKVDTLTLTLADTELIGLFCAFNSNGILLPRIVNRKEVETIKKIGINVEILKTKFTALGNLILCNDKGALISKIFSKTQKKKIEDCLGVESEYCSLAGLNTPGSCGISTNKGCVVHRDCNDEEVEKVKSILKVKVSAGTVNFGSPFVGTGVIANSNGILVGALTTAPELENLIEFLG